MPLGIYNRDAARRNQKGRVCNGPCGEWKVWSEFPWRNKNKPELGRAAVCNACKVKGQRKHYELTKSNPDYSERRKESRRKSRSDLRAEVIAAYGGKCSCCGESRPEFLTIDHINGNGNQHRHSLKKFGVNFYHWLRQQGYPQEEYRLLCFNCNCSLGFFGYCPHEKESCIGDA